MQGDAVRIEDEYTDVQIVDEHNLSMYPTKRLIAIVYEDEVISLSKEYPYVTSPGCCPTNHYFNDSAVARKPRFVIGTPATESEMDRLSARNKDLEEKNSKADQRVNEAISSFEKQVKEAAEKLKEETVARKAAEDQLSFSEKERELQTKMRKEMAEERTTAVNELRDYKEKVSAVMLLVPDRGEMSVGDLVEAAEVGEVMGEKGERDSASQI